MIWPQYCHFYLSIEHIITLGTVINSLSGRIKKHATEEFYTFSQSCDLVKTLCSPLIHIHALQDDGISLIQTFSSMLFHLLLFQHDIILQHTPVSLKTSQFIDFGVQSVISRYNITHRCMRHLHNYFDVTMTEHCHICISYIKTMTLQVVKRANNAMPNAYIPMSNHHLHQRNV